VNGRRRQVVWCGRLERREARIGDPPKPRWFSENALNSSSLGNPQPDRTGRAYLNHGEDDSAIPVFRCGPFPFATSSKSGSLNNYTRALRAQHLPYHTKSIAVIALNHIIKLTSYSNLFNSGYYLS
jgi:hypothetical protein